MVTKVLSVRLVSTVNSKMESRSKFKLRRQVIYIRSNWQNNFEVKRSKVSKVTTRKSLSAHILRKMHAPIYVRFKNEDDRQSMLDVSSNTVQQQKYEIFEITRRQCSSGSIVVCRSRWMPCVHSTMTDRRAVGTQDAIQPTAVDACATGDLASQSTERQQGSGVLHCVNGPIPTVWNNLNGCGV